jgi:uncharacterized protein (TIGR03790 family)
MKFVSILAVFFLGCGAGALFAETGDSVIVVYNTQMPGSKDVAEHYAARRNVPQNQVLGLSLPVAEEISRREYQDQLENPLREYLRAQNLLVMDPDPAAKTPGTLKATVEKVRYAALCYGVPLKIYEDLALKEPESEKVPESLRCNHAAVDSELCLLPWTNSHHMLVAFVVNPCYAATNPAALAPDHGLLLVTRLDGPDATIAGGLVDKALEAETNGLWGRAYFDLRAATDVYKKGDDWIRFACQAAHNFGFDTVLDEKLETFPAGFPMSQIAIYTGWYDPRVSGPFTRPTVEFMPGAFAYHLHSFSASSLRTTTNYWCGPFLAKGATATMGCVFEPFLDGLPHVGLFMPRWLAGFTFAQAAYAAQGTLSWQGTVIGDPIYQPFGHDPKALHERLLAEHSPMADWSIERVVNRDLVRGLLPGQMVQFLREVELTPHSAVLNEKLGDLYLMQNEPDLAIQSWQKALQLNPTPLQAVRLTVELGGQLGLTGKPDQALAAYESVLKQDPDYPDAIKLYQKMESWAEDLHQGSDALRYAKEIDRLSAPPPAK